MKILLVDDDQLVLNGLRRALFSADCSVITANSGKEALEKLAYEECDLIISDMMMPQMDGSQLLEEVSQKYPWIIRASLSGYADPQMTVRGGFYAHQAFMKPCDTSMLKAEIQRISNMLERFPDRLIQNAIGTITSLPVTLDLYQKVKVMLEDEQSSIQDLADVIQNDPAICAKLIQIANNAIFRGKREINSVEGALNRLGTQIVVNIVAMLELYVGDKHKPSKALENLRQHSLIVANLTAKLAPQGESNTGFLIGVLHQIGEFVRTLILPELMKKYLTSGGEKHDFRHLEEHLFNTNSEQLGAYLLHLWAFPSPIIESVLNQNNEQLVLEQPYSFTTALYIAKKIANGETVNVELVDKFELTETLVQLQV